jgi:hypothetical protein
MIMRLANIAPLAALLLLAAASVSAHHSFDAEYDSSKSVTFSGVVTKVDWVNPHAYISVNIEDQKGAVQTYTFELGPPYALVRGGWKRDTVKTGDTIRVENAAPAKDGSSHAGATRDTFLFLASGEKMVMR